MSLRQARQAGLLAAMVLLASACALRGERSAMLLDTGLPQSKQKLAYDVKRYSLHTEILVDSKAIAGSAAIDFNVLAPMDVLELDFDGHYHIDRVESDGTQVGYDRTDSKLFVNLGRTLQPGESGSVSVVYAGRPIEAARPPWEGGFTWARTPSGRPWIATSFEGEGCDIWWPCKDHPGDEPDGVDLYVTVPDGLTVASNGVQVGVTDLPNGRKTFHWQTNVSTNQYGVALNIAPYVRIEGSYESVNGTIIPVVFYAIEEHEAEARKLFAADMHRMIAFFERRLGPYPWGQEKIGIAETPHLGMEHQTINAYGNEFRRDDYGFDWLLHHEFAHEWFGNLMSSSNYADLWLHEGTAAYMQAVFTEEVMGEAAAHHRMYRAYLNIDACVPIAPRGEYSDDQMNEDGTGPAINIYTKGSWVMHSLRYLLGDERFWRAVRILLYDTALPAALKAPIEARHRTTDDFEAIAGEVAGADLGWFFEVYARRGELPALATEQAGDDVVIRWTGVGDLTFDMPVPVRVAGTVRRVEFSNNEARLAGTRLEDILVDPYMQVLRQLSSLPTCEEQRAEAEPDPHERRT